MRIIELNGEKWASVLDFYRALLAALEAPSWHSEGINAAIDSIVWEESTACIRRAGDSERSSEKEMTNDCNSTQIT
jgi:hypothetical protein